MSFEVGDQIWVDEGDSVGCYEFGGVVEDVALDGTLSVRVQSEPILAGVPTGDVRFVRPLEVVDIVYWEDV